MLDSEDLRDQLYSLDSDLWYESVLQVFNLLCFHVELKNVWSAEEYIYGMAGAAKKIKRSDRKSILYCDEIAEYYYKKRNKDNSLYVFRISGDKRERNEIAYELTKAFRKTYGINIILGFVNGKEIAFTGTYKDKSNTLSVIISEWYGYDTEQEIINLLLETEFNPYSRYLKSIAREYVQYPESNMYLLFECNPITYEVVVKSPIDGSNLYIEKVDKEETLAQNMSYYKEKYGDDYFLDDNTVKIDIDNSFISDEDEEFEWTMLELELLEENDNAEDVKISHLEDEDSDYQDYDESYYNLNPEQMLELIKRGVKTDSLDFENSNEKNNINIGSSSIDRILATELVETKEDEAEIEALIDSLYITENEKECERLIDDYAKKRSITEKLLIRIVEEIRDEDLIEYTLRNHFIAYASEGLLVSIIKSYLSDELIEYTFDNHINGVISNKTLKYIVKYNEEIFRYLVRSQKKLIVNLDLLMDMVKYSYEEDDITYVLKERFKGQINEKFLTALIDHYYDNKYIETIFKQYYVGKVSLEFIERVKYENYRKDFLNYLATMCTDEEKALSLLK